MSVDLVKVEDLSHMNPLLNKFENSLADSRQ